MYKKQSLMIFLLLTSLSLIQCKTVNLKKAPELKWVSPKIVDFLGKDKLQVILKATKIQSYIVESMAMSSTGLNGYGITGMGATLSPSEVNILKYLVVDSAGYNFVLRKRCMIMPKFGFSFHYQKKQVNLLIGFQCKQWQFAFDDDKPQQFKLEDFDSIKGKLTKLIKRLFPNEELKH